MWRCSTSQQLDTSKLHRWPGLYADKGGIIELEPADERQLMDGAALEINDLDPTTDATELVDGPYLVVDVGPSLRTIIAILGEKPGNPNGKQLDGHLLGPLPKRGVATCVSSQPTHLAS